MGVTTAVVTSVGCLIGGALIGGGSVYYYKYRQQQKEKVEREKYLKILKDLNLRDKRVRARLSTKY